MPSVVHQRIPQGRLGRQLLEESLRNRKAHQEMLQELRVEGTQIRTRRTTRSGSTHHRLHRQRMQNQREHNYDPIVQIFDDLLFTRWTSDLVRAMQ